MSKACPWVYMRPCLEDKCMGWQVFTCNICKSENFPSMPCKFKIENKCVRPAGYCKLIDVGGI